MSTDISKPIADKTWTEFAQLAFDEAIDELFEQIADYLGDELGIEDPPDALIPLLKEKMAERLLNTKTL